MTQTLNTFAERPSCSLCGRVADDEFAIGWIVEVTRSGRTNHVCATCARINLRAIEGKLDQEWW